MPDHVHLLIEGLKPDSSALHFIDKAKQSSGYWHARQSGRRLWQKTGWDRVLRSDEDTWVVARYIINNPVRADLVQAPVDYPFWGSLVYSREEVLEFIAAPAG